MVTRYIVGSEHNSFDLQEVRNLTANKPTEQQTNQSTMGKFMMLTTIAFYVSAIIGSEPDCWDAVLSFQLVEGSFPKVAIAWAGNSCQVQGPPFCGNKLEQAQNKDCMNEEEWMERIVGLFSDDEKKECKFICN